MTRKTAPSVSDLYEAFRRPLQSAISCFTTATLLADTPYGVDRVRPLRLSGQPTPLGRGAALFLRFAHEIRVAQRADDWEIQTVSYGYWLQDRFGYEFVLYQWETSERSPVTTPHVHVRALTAVATVRPAEAQLPPASHALLGRLGKAHLPTGFVTFPEILRMVVADLGVAPLERNPTKVAERLAAAEDALRASLAWTTAPSR